MKILIVEDEERIRKVVRSFLVKNGYIVREAADGEEGLDLFYEWNPDLVLLDVMMPKKDGYEVCKAIKSEMEYIPLERTFTCCRARINDSYKP